MKDLIVSVDLGGTNMRAALVDTTGRVVDRVVKPTLREAKCPDALDGLVCSMLAERGAREACGSVVIGVPGRVDYRAGRLEHAPNLPASWVPELTEAHLEDRLGVPTFLANDADLAAVGEAYFGAGQDHTDVVYVTISTGVGAGVVLARRLLRGGRSMVEIGHTIVALHDLDHGSDATVEHLAAGPALARRAQSVGCNADGAALVKLVHDGNPDAIWAWDQVMQAAGAAVVNLAHLFSPDAIVIGGGVGRNGSLVHDPLTRLLERHGPKNLTRPVALVEAALGDDAGLVGAAGWAPAIGGRP